MRNKIPIFLTSFAIPAMAAVLALPASAETVDFDTTGSLACGNLVVDNPGETCAISGGGSMMTVTKGVTTATVSVTAIGDSYVGLLAGPTPNADVDVMTLRDTYTLAAHAATSPTVSLTGSTFTFNVDQTGCLGCTGSGTGTGSLTGSINGVINSKNVTAAITYPSNTIAIDGVSYVLDNQTWLLAQTGKTSKSNPYGQEIYTAQVLPEPTFLSLSGLGFGVVALAAYRRRRIASHLSRGNSVVS